MVDKGATDNGPVSGWSCSIYNAYDRFPLSAFRSSSPVASLTIENYVKAIYQLSAEGGGEIAATGKLAETLAVSPSTVTSMLKTLGESGLAKYTPYEGARLT